MSDESEHKIDITLPRKEQRNIDGEGPKRHNRREVDYRNSGEGGPSEERRVKGIEGVVITQGGSRQLRDSSVESVWGGSATESWSPQTVRRRTDKLAEGLQEVRQQITMAKKEEMSMADLMAMMLEMSRKDKEDAKKREEEREERAIEREEKRLREQADREDERRKQEEEREEKRLQNRKDREEERRREDNIREERRIEREAKEREVAAEREVQLIATLKAAQPVVPQTIHLDNTKLPVMEKGEDVQLFLELFESALTAGRVPVDKWLPKLHASLNTETKLAIKEDITNPIASYEDVKKALIGQTHLTFAAASESLMTLDQGNITKDPIRQAVQKIARLFEKVTSEATTLRETCLYSAVAVTRFALGRDAKQYIDIKGSFEWSEFSCSIEEWQRTNPGKPVWDYKWRQASERGTYHEKQPFRGFATTRKQGECYFCGKQGHYAQECRARQKDWPAEVPPTQTTQNVKREQTPDRNSTQRPLSETTCFICHQKGHISPNCPSKRNKVKKVRVQEDKIETLKLNKVFGAVGPHRMPITMDTGAEITVIPEEAVQPHQFSGESRVLKSFNKAESRGKVCTVDVTIGNTILQKKAVTQPGASLGWSACLSLNLADPEERDILTQQIANRAGMTQKETRYLPPEVREGVWVSGIPINETKVVKKIDKWDGEKQEKEPVQPEQTGAQVTTEDKSKFNEEEVVAEEVGKDEGRSEKVWRGMR